MDSFVCVFMIMHVTFHDSFLKWNVSDKATGLIRNNCLSFSSFFASSRGFSYVDLVEGAHDGRFYALKRILCHDREGRKEAQTEVEMHRLFNHPNILSLTSHTFMERGTKCEAWLLLPYINVSGLCFVFPFQASNKCKISVTSERCSMPFKSVSCAEFVPVQKGSLWSVLEKLRDKGSSMPESRILHILHDICEGLKDIHDKGYAHRYWE